MIGNRVAKQKSKKERTHGRHSSTDRFSAGQEQAECGKAAFRQGKCIRIGGKARLFRQSACEQGFRPRSLRHGGLRRPLRSTRLGTGPVEHREAILRKKGRLNAKSCVFSTIICKGGFPFLRYVSAGAAATFFAAFVPWPVFCFAKLHCFATASFSSICIYSFLSVCFMSADVELIWPRMLPPPFRAARSAYVQVPPESVWSKGKALFAGRAFFRCPVRSKQKFRRSDTPEAAGNGWR